MQSQLLPRPHPTNPSVHLTLHQIQPTLHTSIKPLTCCVRSSPAVCARLTSLRLSAAEDIPLILWIAWVLSSPDIVQSNNVRGACSVKNGHIVCDVLNWALLFESPAWVLKLVLTLAGRRSQWFRWLLTLALGCIASRLGTRTTLCSHLRKGSCSFPCQILIVGS